MDVFGDSVSFRVREKIARPYNTQVCRSSQKFFDIHVSSSRGHSKISPMPVATNIRSLDHDETIGSRRLGSSSSASLTPNSSFVFDGTNSDIALQLYVRHRAGAAASPVNLTSVPAAVTSRLSPFNIEFKSLPGLVQRALLWDSGFAISPDDEPVQIWMLESYAMADIAVPKSDVNKMGCQFLNCSQPNAVMAYYTNYCSGNQMLNVSRCVVDKFKDEGAATYLGMMWSVGGDPDMAPELRLREHAWTDPNTGDHYSVYAVHTDTKEHDPTWNQCRQDKGYASLTVPCYRKDKLTSEQLSAIVKPTGSPWVTTWLQEFSQEEKTGFDAQLLIPIILSVVLVMTGIGLGWLGWRQRTRLQEKQGSTAKAGGRLQYSGSGSRDGELRLTSVSSPLSLHGSTISSPDYESAGSNKILQILLGSDHLHDKRVPYESLVFERALSKGASGEVWVCEYNGQQVAVKRLLPRKKHKAESVQAFAEEIELSASLDHPHIVEFIGVAWSSLNNLVMVLEYLPVGSLQAYLDKNVDVLSWARDKIYVAIGIAQALKFLHDRSPPLIHRDLKSNNILLTNKLEPKLIDFGVSRGLVDLTMTGGVGTPYWTAPEVLEGKHYTEQADIYSFGVVLSELDTGKIPYSDAVTKDGVKLKPFHVLQQVMAGTLRPSFANDCPPRIQRVGAACLSLDPLMRPTADKLLQELEGRNSEIGE